MDSVDKERYLGDILSNDTKMNSNIQARQNKGTGYVDQILSILKDSFFWVLLLQHGIDVQNHNFD